jgi:putative flippase GtrA
VSSGLRQICRDGVSRLDDATAAELGRVIRYVVVGLLTASVYFSGVALGLTVFHLSTLEASLTAQILSSLIAYYGHGTFSFQVEPNKVYFARFVFVLGISILVNVRVVWLLSQRLKLGNVLTIAILAVAVSVGTYLANRLWVFLPALARVGRGINHEAVRSGDG